MDTRASGRWESFDDSDGLGHECVCLSEDGRGNIWVGTSNGLSRYDGRNFENLTLMDGSENIRNIYLDKECNLWIATNKGLAQYDGKNVINFTKSDGLVDNDVHCIHQDDDGNLWIGTGNGLSRYDGSGFINLGKNDGLAGDYIHCIHQYLDGSIWIGTSVTVKRLQKEVADRKRAESALRESERRYRFLYEEGTVISLIIGIDGIIRDVNKAFIKELGYPKDEVLGKNAIELVVPEQRERISKQLIQDFKGEYTPEIDVGVCAKDGTIHTVLFSSGQAILYENNIPSSILITGIDITDRRKAEELARIQQQQLIQADKMATLGILVSGIAHEINNPNTFILLNARIFSKIWNSAMPILDRYYQENGDFNLAGMPYSQAYERIGLLVSGISEGSQRIQRIVQGLKDYARLDPGDMNQSVNINSVVEASILIVNNLIKKSTEKFTYEYGRDIPSIRGNAQRLEQVIINLLTNACQSLQDKSKGLSISTSYDKSSGRAVIEVCDEGIGISPDDLKHIMDPFFTTKRSSGGTGLGLSISHNIVSSHKGELNFISELGKGTKVILTLPVQCKSEARS